MKWSRDTSVFVREFGARLRDLRLKARFSAYGRELWVLGGKEIASEWLALEAATLIAKWVARGLTQAVLQAIRSDVFNVAAPIAP